MGMLVNGQWIDKWYDTKVHGGKFVRDSSQFRGFVENDVEANFPAEANRYHLYVSLACPWAHRTLIFRALKELEDIITISIVHPHMLEHGWTFKRDSAATGDAVFDADYLYQIYLKANPHYTGRATVPVLWDKKKSNYCQ